MWHEEDLDKLKKQRMVTKRKLTRKINRLQEGISDENPAAILHSSYDEVSLA